MWSPQQQRRYAAAHIRRPELAHFLLEGIRNVQYRDDELTFRSYRASLERETTAIAELLASLAWLGPQAAGALDALETIATTAGFNRDNRRRARIRDRLDPSCDRSG